MVNRINLLLKAKNITARQFAEEIGIQPSGMSHILSGRNNPSLDFVMKVIRRYPEIDINWLMFGKGEMYESRAAISVSPASPSTQQSQATRLMATPTTRVVPQRSSDPITQVQADLFSQPHENAINESPLKTDSKNGNLGKQNFSTPVSVPTPVVAVSDPHNPRKLVKLLAFYDDQTFVEYRPQ